MRAADGAGSGPSAKGLALEFLEQRTLLHAGHGDDPDHFDGELSGGGILPPENDPRTTEWIAAHPLDSGRSSSLGGGGPESGGETIPALNSLPGAPATIYLDFDGHFEAVWGSYTNVVTPAYSLDADPDFDAAEIAAIVEIWQRASEDFAPYNVNVSTVDPGDFSNGVGLRVAIGGAYTDWYGIAGSGAAWIYSFINPLPNTVYVFEENLSNGFPQFVADIVSHETGHAFGLFHQSLYDGGGALLEEYNPGNPPDWGPLMGNPLLSNRSTWHDGTTSSATIFQLDYDVIGTGPAGVPFRADDHGDNTGSATALVVVGDNVSGSGIVGSMTDEDYFSFTTGAGAITIDVDVAALSPNLDARIELRDEFGGLVASADPSGDLSASISTTVGAGDYYVVVGSHGTYGDVGQYTVTGTIVGNSPPVAIAGSVYLTAEGLSLELDGSASYDPDVGDVLTYRWDVNGDLDFSDAVGVNPTLSWSELTALGIDDGLAYYNVSLEVDDGKGGVTVSAPVTLGVFNEEPNTHLSGPWYAVRGQPTTYTLHAYDASAVDQAAGFTFEIDWNGDGTVDETVIGPSGTTVTHVFPEDGPVSVMLSATDKDGGEGTWAKAVTVQAWALQPDSINPGLTNLVFGGSEDDDLIAILAQEGTIVILDVTFVGGFSIESATIPGVTGRVIVYGQGGDDLISGQSVAGVTFELHGDAGNDTLTGGSADDWLFGGPGNDSFNGLSGNDVLIGGTGIDQMAGGYGRDLLIGGADADLLQGGGGDDLLISGTTAFDNDIVALSEILAEWTSARDYATRIDNLSGTGSGPMENGTTFLIPDVTVFDDAVAGEWLFGDAGMDWFFFHLVNDILFDAEAGEVETGVTVTP